VWAVRNAIGDGDPLRVTYESGTWVDVADVSGLDAWQSRYVLLCVPRMARSGGRNRRKFGIESAASFFVVHVVPKTHPFAFLKWNDSLILTLAVLQYILYEQQSITLIVYKAVEIG
jgi:hypothetical protein